jgi:hypothetical protein
MAKTEIRISSGLMAVLVCLVAGQQAAAAGILDKQQQLEAQTFWDNRDWDWYKANIPFFECPDAEVNTTYYYRWELTTKHLTYGSPASGYSYTEFIDRPFWSGAYGAISCPAGHQLYEVRWLGDGRYAQDYSRYWFRTPGAQPRNYSTWLADAVWAVRLAQGDEAFAKELLADLVRNFEGWEKRQFVAEVGMFWQIGHDDGMEFNIMSRQTKDILRGAPSYRPSFNAYMWADAQAITRIAEAAGEKATAERFRAKAGQLKAKVQSMLWDPKREYFFPMLRNDEEDKDGAKMQAMTLTHQSGRFAGSPHGREEIGFVPWQFSLPDPGYEAAWKFLMDKEYFYADFGPLTVERRDPMFLLQNWCCWWSGMSWPYATTQTLKAMANLLQGYQQNYVSRADYFKLLRNYALSHRKGGKPYLAEALHPDTGSFDGHDGYNHSEHYFHSGFDDLIITGLVGVKPRPDDVIEIDPLAPAEWPWFALDDLPYHGSRVSIVWDKDGTRYGKGAGLQILVNGKKAASSARLERLEAKVPVPPATRDNKPVRVNYAVNNDGTYYPRLAASFSAPETPLAAVNDGNSWYHVSPPNRWTTAGSPNASDWLEIDLGTPRKLDALKLNFLDDGEQVVAPAKYDVEYWAGNAWKAVPGQQRTPAEPIGHRANVVRFPTVDIAKLRVTFTHGPKGRTGLTEVETWGDLSGAYEPAPPPPGNLALNLSGEGFPKASASFHDVYGGVPRLANDGKTAYRPTPLNRWTSYGSTNATDWLEIDFGEPKEIGRIELCLYDDHGGVQPPASYTVQTWEDSGWREIEGQLKTPALPVGSAVNTVRFPKLTITKFRVVFTHKGQARSGLTEILAWRE